MLRQNLIFFLILHIPLVFIIILFVTIIKKKKKLLIILTMLSPLPIHLVIVKFSNNSLFPSNNVISNFGFFS